MNYRLASPSDTANIRKLWEYCFDDPDEFNDWFFENRYQPHNTLVAAENGRIASALQLLPYTIQLRGQKMTTSYIVGVSTWPEDRGKGYITRLLRYALEEARRRKQWVNILLPFKYEFYRKYGWETCYSHAIYSGSIDSFNSYCREIEITGQFRPVNKEKDIPLLNKFYLTFAKQLNGFVCRNSQDWMRLLDDIKLYQGHAYLYTDKEGLGGYIIYYIENRKFSIREMAYTDQKSKYALLKFALGHSDIIDRIQWQRPNIYSENFFLQKYGIKRMEKPFVMGRIVDVAKALEAVIPEPADIELDLAIEIVDRFLEWNNQIYNIKSVDGKTAVYPTNKNPDFKIDITSLAQLLWGYISVDQAIDYGLLEVNRANKIDQIMDIFPKAIPYIYEDY